MPRSVTLEFGRCGWGHEPGPPRVIRLGWVVVMVMRDSVIAALRESNEMFRRMRGNRDAMLRAAQMAEDVQ